MKKTIDIPLLITVLLLVIFGMITIASVSVLASYNLTTRFVARGDMLEPNNYYYVLRNMAHVFMAFSALIIVLLFPRKLIEKFTYPYLIGVFGLLIFVLAFGEQWGGARGWIQLPGIPFTIQPTEFLKIGLILAFAKYFKYNNKHNLNDFKKGFLPFLGLLGICVILVGLQPDFGTLIVLIPLSFMMYFMTGAAVKYVIGLAFIAIIGAFGIYSYGEYDPVTGRNLNRLGYITQRIDNFLMNTEDFMLMSTPNDSDLQNKQGLIAIGSGGLFGLGFGQSIQKFGYLPEVQGDFIFSVIMEEHGFIRTMFLILAYFYILHRCLYISRYSKDDFAKYVSAGIGILIIWQAFINIGVNLRIIPLTGVTLPFVSYGGASLLTLMAGVGIVLSFSRDLDQSKQVQNMYKRKSSFSLEE